MSAFDYAAMTGRNLGFVTAAEQKRLREGRVFVCGVGGMGGACLQSLARAGVGALEIADFDAFEISNLNRQVFATVPDLGRPKTEVTEQRLHEIHPDLDVHVHGRDWLDHLDVILARCRVVVNAMDDTAAGIRIYREAKDRGGTVIDAYTSTLPSVTRVLPTDRRPEERLGYPTAGVALDRITKVMLDACRLAELEYVFTHSSTADHVDWAIAAEVMAGTRPRMSFAPMVITTGNLMAYEAVAALCKRPTPTDCRGWFFNPYRARVERPRSALVAAIRRAAVRRQLARFR